MTATKNNTDTTKSDGEFDFGGFQIDLLGHLVQYAAADNVTLTWDLVPAPLPTYGGAFDLVAHDCAVTTQQQSDLCHTVDLIVGNYYATPQRTLRAELSPPWLKSTITTVKYLDKQQQQLEQYGGVEITTLKQATEAGASVCLKRNTFYAGIVQDAFPSTEIVWCGPNTEECLQVLKQPDSCVLYVDDELQLRYQEAWDTSLEVTRESFNTQYIVWPLSYNLPVAHRKLLEKWLRQAVTTATLDTLYSQYFQKALCPIGTAGDACELPCDPLHGQADKRGDCVCESTKWTGGTFSQRQEGPTQIVESSGSGLRSCGETNLWPFSPLCVFLGLRLHGILYSYNFNCFFWWSISMSVFAQHR